MILPTFGLSPDYYIGPIRRRKLPELPKPPPTPPPPIVILPPKPKPLPPPPPPPPKPIGPDTSLRLFTTYDDVVSSYFNKKR